MGHPAHDTARLASWGGPGGEAYGTLSLGGARSWTGRLNRPGGRIGRSRQLTSGRSQFRHVERLPVFFRVPEVILNLQVKPAFSAGVEGDRETDGHLRADSCTPVKEAGQRLSTHAERSRSV